MESNKGLNVSGSEQRMAQDIEFINRNSRMVNCAGVESNLMTLSSLDILMIKRKRVAELIINKEVTAFELSNANSLFDHIENQMKAILGF